MVAVRLNPPQPLTERIAEKLALSLQEIPLVNKLGIGAGLAARANMREGDRAMFRAAYGALNCYTANQLEGLFSEASERYGRALALATKAYGVDPKLHSAVQKGSWLEMIVDLPDDSLRKTKFGEPVANTSRRMLLETLAHRTDYATALYLDMGKLNRCPGTSQSHRANVVGLVEDARKVMYSYQYSREKKVERIRREKDPVLQKLE